MTAAVVAVTAVVVPAGGAVAAGGGTWSMTAPMAVSRTGHTATVLPDRSVLTVGGTSSTLAQTWQPTLGRWAAAGSMSIDRTGATATLLPDGRVLVAGGCTGSHCPGVTATTELYDPETRSWSGGPAMPTAHAYATATLLNSGKVLVAGGCTGRLCGQLTAAAALFDPTTGRWSPTGSMTAPRRWHSAVLLPGGQVLAVGGEGTSTAELYDSRTGRWSPTGAMRTARANFTLTALRDGTVLAAGGCNGYYCQDVTATAETYDPATATWTPTGSLRHDRQFDAAAALPSGRVLAIGGQDDTFTALTSVEVYDPASRSWTAVAPLHHARSALTATTLPDGRVLAAGGGTNTAEIYTP